jgi:hypothetical protein
MEAKTESKIVLSVLLLGPLSGGILMLTNNSWGIFPYVLILIAIFGYLYLWIPRSWFGRGDEHKRRAQHKGQYQQRKRKKR